MIEDKHTERQTLTPLLFMASLIIGLFASLATTGALGQGTGKQAPVQLNAISGADTADYSVQIRTVGRAGKLPAWNITPDAASAYYNVCQYWDETIGAVYADQAAPYRQTVSLRTGDWVWPPTLVRIPELSSALECAETIGLENLYLCAGHYPGASTYTVPITIKPASNPAICELGPAFIERFPEPKGERCDWGDQNCTTCVDDPVGEFMRLDDRAPEILGFNLGTHPPPQFDLDLFECRVEWPSLFWSWTNLHKICFNGLDWPLAFHGHFQGVQRLTSGEGQYLAVTRDIIQDGDDGSSGIAVVEMVSQNDAGDPFTCYGNRCSQPYFLPDQPPPTHDKIVETEPISEALSHPGGFQMMGDILAVSLEPDEPNGEPPTIKFYNMAEPTNPQLIDAPLRPLSRAQGNKGSFVAMTRLETGRILLLVGRSGGDYPIDFYLSDVPNSVESFSFFYRWPEDVRHPDDVIIPKPAPGAKVLIGWDAYQSLNFVTDCNDGQLYLIGTGNREDTVASPFWDCWFDHCKPSGKNMADLYRLDLQSSGVGYQFVKVATSFFGRIWENNGNFDAAAGIYVDPDNQMYLYATEHENTGLSDSVRFVQYGSPATSASNLDSGNLDLTELNGSPAVVGTFPESGYAAVSKQTAIHVGFNEPMLTESLALSISPSIEITPEWSQSDQNVTLVHDGLAPDTKYTIELMAKDLSGTPLPEMFTWSFTTTITDDAPPMVLSVSPANDSSSVPAKEPFVITFNERVSPKSFVFDGAAIPVGWDTRWDLANTSATITHGTLHPDTIYELTITVADLAGNAMSKPYSWTFTTWDVLEPFNLYLPLTVKDN